MTLEERIGQCVLSNGEINIIMVSEEERTIMINNGFDEVGAVLDDGIKRYVFRVRILEYQKKYFNLDVLRQYTRHLN